MIEDMDQVSDRLSQTKVDRLTVSIEEDIIQSIEEMIEALQAAQQELMDQQQQQQQQQTAAATAGKASGRPTV